MIIRQLKIENLRGIFSAKINFDGNTLFVGTNNIGKSTICEALDLVIGPDTLSRQDPIDEYVFCYVKKADHTYELHR